MVVIHAEILCVIVRVASAVDVAPTSKVEVKIIVVSSCRRRRAAPAGHKPITPAIRMLLLLPAAIAEVSLVSVSSSSRSLHLAARLLWVSHQAATIPTRPDPADLLQLHLLDSLSPVEVTGYFD